MNEDAKKPQKPKFWDKFTIAVVAVALSCFSILLITFEPVGLCKVGGLSLIDGACWKAEPTRVMPKTAPSSR